MRVKSWGCVAFVSPSPSISIKTNQILFEIPECILGLSSTWSLILFWSSLTFYFYGNHSFFTEESVDCVEMKIPPPFMNLKKCSLIEYNDQKQVAILCLNQHHQLYVMKKKEIVELLAEKVVDFAHTQSTLCITTSQYETKLFSISNNFELTEIHLLHYGFTHLVAGFDHFIGLTSQHQVYVYGSNLHGQLGLDYMRSHVNWTLNDYLNGLEVIQIAAGDLHSLFLTRSGILYACGSNEYGQCGSRVADYPGEKISKSLPIPVFEIDYQENDALQLTAGSRHSIFKVGNKVYGTGWNAFGQLGNFQEKINEFTLLKALFKPKNVPFNKITVGPWQTFFY
jgi:alpha-tubulin suppressor-like RCC1 family protein